MLYEYFVDTLSFVYRYHGLLGYYRIFVSQFFADIVTV